MPTPSKKTTRNVLGTRRVFAAGSCVCSLFYASISTERQAALERECIAGCKNDGFLSQECSDVFEYPTGMTTDKYDLCHPCATRHVPSADPNQLPGSTCMRHPPCDDGGKIREVCPVRADHYARGDSSKEWHSYGASIHYLCSVHKGVYQFARAQNTPDLSDVGEA